MYYKLGSQIFSAGSNTEPEKELFEWNICAIYNKSGGEGFYFPLGIRNRYDPIIKLARNLVDELNKENKK